MTWRRGCPQRGSPNNLSQKIVGWIYEGMLPVIGSDHGSLRLHWQRSLGKAFIPSRGGSPTSPECGSGLFRFLGWVHQVTQLFCFTAKIGPPPPPNPEKFTKSSRFCQTSQSQKPPNLVNPLFLRTVHRQSIHLILGGGAGVRVWWVFPIFSGTVKWDVTKEA